MMKGILVFGMRFSRPKWIIALVYIACRCYLQQTPSLSDKILREVQRNQAVHGYTPHRFFVLATTTIQYILSDKQPVGTIARCSARHSGQKLCAFPFAVVFHSTFTNNIGLTINGCNNFRVQTTTGVYCTTLTMLGWTTHLKFVGGPTTNTATMPATATLVLNATQKIHCAATIGFAVLRLEDNQCCCCEKNNFHQGRVLCMRSIVLQPILYVCVPCPQLHVYIAAARSSTFQAPQ